MGIDIGFVSEDIKGCPKANCREYRNTLVGFVEPEKEHEPWQGLRAYRLDTSVVRRDAPRHYRPTDDLDQERYAVVGHMERRAVQPHPEDEMDELFPGLASTGPPFRLIFVPQRLTGKEEFLARADEADRGSDGSRRLTYTAWDEVLSREERLSICGTCPLRPLGEDTCYARFSNYPGMASFRVGLAAAIMAMACIDQEMGQDPPEENPFAWWTLRRLLERTGHSSLMELHRDVLAYFGEESPEGMLRAERFFDRVADLLNDALKGVEGAEVSQSPRLGEGPREQEVESLLAGLIYRDDPYVREQMEYLLPRLYAYQATAEWALWEIEGDSNLRRLLLSFLERWRTLTQMLHIGWLAEVRVFVSY